MSYKKIHISDNTGSGDYPYSMDTDGYTVKPYNKYTFVYPDGTSEDVVMVPSGTSCRGCVFNAPGILTGCLCSTPDICMVDDESSVAIIPISKILEDI